MKLLHLFFVLAAVQVAWFMFYMPNMNSSVQDIFVYGNYSNVTSPNGTFTTTDFGTGNGTANPVADNILNNFLGNKYTSNDIWRGFLNPIGGASTVVFTIFILVAVFVFVFGLFASRNEMVYLAIIFILLLGVGAIPCISLWNMVNSDAGIFVCAVSSPNTPSNCLLSNLFAWFTAGILYVMWFLSCLEWWSARSTA